MTTLRFFLSRALTALPVLAVVAACSEITNLEQTNPGQILVRDAYVPENAALLVNGAIGDFECGFHRYVVATGLMSDELANAWLHENNFLFDSRNHPTNGVYGTQSCGSAQFLGVYTPLSVARASADTILARLQQWTDEQVPNRGALVATSAAYAGYSLLLLGESMCSAAIDIGPEMTQDQLLAEAVSRFDLAIQAATTAGATDIANFATLGRARARLELGELAAAAADAATIPAGFAQGSNYSSIEPIWENLTFDGVADPRVGVVNSGTVGSNGSTVLRRQTKYASRAASIPIARTAEARLIVAEHLVATGDLVGAADIINELHAAAGLPDYDATGATAADVLDQIIEERARELFLEGHRFADANRYDLPLYPAAGEPFPNGGTYGDQRCFPLPDVERNNNPNIPSL